MSIKYLLILAFTLFLSACANTPQVHKTTELKSTKNLIPSWIENPSNNGNFGVVGISKKQKTLKLQKRVALLKARASLSEMINIQIKSEIEIKEKLSKDGFESSVNSSSQQTSNNMIQKAYVKEEFIDQDGNLYIWLVI